MILSLTAQQMAFFTKNGFLELEGVLKPEEISEIAHLKSGRDLWRTNAFLKKLLLSRKMSNIALTLAGKDRLILALDHCFPADFHLEKPEKLKKFFSIQDSVVCILFQVFEPLKASPPKLGHYPFCQEIGNILVIRPELLITWPKLNFPVYVAVYANLNAVYIENPCDPAAGALKELGYEYGDVLRSETHPLLQRTNHR